MDLFISYSRDDKAWVAELWRALRDENHDAWMDRFIVPASDWWESILEQVENCRCFVYVMTPKSVDSIYCQAELAYALALNKPILPLMLKPCTFPDHLSKKRVQFQTISDEMSLERVLLRIEQGLSRIREDVRDGKYEPQSAKRPSEPKASRDAGEALQIAEDAIASHNYEAAVKLLEDVAANAIGVLRNFARERLSEIQSLHHCGQEYARIKPLLNNPVLAQRVWQVYQQSECAHYDPDNLAARFKITAPAEPIKPASVRQQPQKMLSEFFGNNQPEQPKTLPEWPSEKISKPISAKPTSTRSKVYDILPAPFSWIDIPAGKVALESGGYVSTFGQTFEVAAFQIAKYPITNAQYAKFIDAGGYQQSKWWTTEGWQRREQAEWTQPRYWDDSDFNSVEQPVVGVSWFEVVAFCLWLSDVTSENIMLPTDQQWQRAAQGNDGRKYPWGNEWDCTRCNNSVHPCDSNRTTPVRQYEGKGNSPFGVVDMAGNVLEWCLTDYNKGFNNINTHADDRILRGGSWNNTHSFNLGAVDRFWYNPNNWFIGFGVRCARALT